MENNVNKTYGLAVQAVHTENGQDIVIQNQNHFRINEIVVTVTSTVSTTTDTPVTDNATASDCVCVQKKHYYIVSLAAGEIWHSKDAKETENKIEKTDSFVPFAHYEGKEQIIDPSLYDEEKGIYQGEPHHALVWPDADSNDTTLIFNPAPHIQVTLEFIARGPRVAFCGHSFTGLWDSSYYYFRELAKAAGLNAQIHTAIGAELEFRVMQVWQRAMKSAQLSAMRCLQQMTITIISSLQEIAMRQWKRRMMRHPVSVFMLSVKPCFVAHKSFLKRLKKNRRHLRCGHLMHTNMVFLAAWV